MAYRNDATVTPPHREALHHGIAGSWLVVIPDSTHATPVDQPAAFDTAVLEFLATVDRRDKSR